MKWRTLVSVAAQMKKTWEVWFANPNPNVWSTYVRVAIILDYFSRRIVSRSFYLEWFEERSGLWAQLVPHSGMTAGVETFLARGNLGGCLDLSSCSQEWVTSGPAHSKSLSGSLSVRSCSQKLPRWAPECHFAATLLCQRPALKDIYSEIPRFARAGTLENSTVTHSYFLSFTGLSFQIGHSSTIYLVSL